MVHLQNGLPADGFPSTQLVRDKRLGPNENLLLLIADGGLGCRHLMGHHVRLLSVHDSRLRCLGGLRCLRSVLSVHLVLLVHHILTDGLYVDTLVRHGNLLGSQHPLLLLLLLLLLMSLRGLELLDYTPSHELIEANMKPSKPRTYLLHILHILRHHSIRHVRATREVYAWVLRVSARSYIHSVREEWSRHLVIFRKTTRVAIRS